MSEKSVWMGEDATLSLNGNSDYITISVDKLPIEFVDDDYSFSIKVKDIPELIKKLKEIKKRIKITYSILDKSVDNFEKIKNLINMWIDEEEEDPEAAPDIIHDIISILNDTTKGK